MKIKYKIILGIIGSLVVFNSIFSFFFIYYQHKNELSRLNAKILDTDNLIEKAIADALWNIDKNRIEQGLKSFLMDSEISGIDLEDTLGINNFSLKKEETAHHHLIPSPRILRIQNEVIGKITVYYNDSVLQEKQNSFLLVMVVITISMIFLSTLVLMRISNKILAPLEILVDGLKRVDEGDYSHRIYVNTKDEFKLIETYFNKMSRKIQKEFEDRIKREEELERAKLAAEKASNAKGYFLSSMSHEIRTPLTVIIGLIEIMEFTNLDEEQKKYVKRLSSSSAALLDLINEVLDFSRIESGKIDLNPQELSVEDLLESVVDSFLLAAQAKNLEIYYFLENNVPEMIISDRGRLRQILMNLISNAIKFTKEGEIYIIVKKIFEKDSKIQLEFSISDTGIGIPKDSLDDVFLNYNRGQSNYTKTQSGTGLGLPIVKKLVELLGGSISVESEENQGSTFYFTINAEVPTLENRFSKNLCLEGFRALLVDDNPTHLAILRTMLREEKIDVIDIPDATSAINFLSKGKDVQFILTDFQMPHINGLEFARMVREDLKISNIPIILYSAQTHDIDHSQHPSISEIITKPIKKSKLIDIIKKSIQCENIHPWKDMKNENKPEIIMDNQKFTILLAEDNDMNRETTGILLRNEGYSVESAENGKVAVQIYKKSRPNLVLMDIQMPEMDGYEAVRAIRELEKGTEFHVPIIALTAFALKITREEAKKSGMDDFLAKPVIPSELFKRIAYHLSIS